MIKNVCIIGAGTMGTGIAQVAAQSGMDTILYDADAKAIEKSKENIRSGLQYLIDKKKITEKEKGSTLSHLQFSNNITDCIADVIIEAIIEKAEAKISLFDQLTKLNKADTVFASNTSSLSIAQIQSQIKNPGRVIGMHFFNPPAIMKLVEVATTELTDQRTIQVVLDLARQMNKTPVLCKDSPGFIVNRIARHYYLEAMKLAEENIAGFETIDSVMESAGFKMGPFKLMDLIGIDVNLAVSQSIYESFHHAKRFKPSSIQINKVSKGELGKKTGKGFYQY